MILSSHEASLPLFQNLQLSITDLIWAISLQYRGKIQSMKKVKRLWLVERINMKISLTNMTSEMIHINTIQRMRRLMTSPKTVTHSKNRLLILRFTMSVLPKKESLNLMYSEKRLWSPLCNLRSLFHLMTPEKSQLRRSFFRTTISLKMKRFWTMFLPISKTSPKAKLVVQWTWGPLCPTPRLLATTKQRCLL